MKCDPIIGLANDTTFIDRLKDVIPLDEIQKQRISIIIPYYKKPLELLNTLKSLTLQTIAPKQFDVIVVDDGSGDDIATLTSVYRAGVFFSFRLIKKIRNGFELSKVRNIGLKVAYCDHILIIDADILPCKDMVERHLRCLCVSSNVISIGFRTNLSVKDRSVEELLALDVSKQALDWRVSKYFATEDSKKGFKLGDTYWGACSGGNIAFNKNIVNKNIWFREDFNFWGGEDTVWAYECYKQGYYFYPNFQALSIHQEGIETSPIEYTKDKAKISSMVSKYCPRVSSVFVQEPFECVEDIPFVSFWITSFNNALFIGQAIKSLKGFPFRHEIVVVDDGSTDDTLEVLSKMKKQAPHLRVYHREHLGISPTFTQAIQLCRGEFVVQLDSDDLICNLNAINNAVFQLVYRPYGLAYGKYNIISLENHAIENGWDYPYCSRDEALFEGMRMHPPRVMRMRDYRRSGVPDSTLTSAVDYDLYSKVLEVTYGFCTKELGYSYRRRLDSVTQARYDEQGLNTKKVVQNRLTENNIVGATLKEGVNPRKNVIICDETHFARFTRHLGLTSLIHYYIDVEKIPIEELVDPLVFEIDKIQKNYAPKEMSNLFRFEI